MDGLAVSFLVQLIFCGLSQLLVTLPAVWFLFQRYIDKSYSLVLRIFFVYLAVFGIVTVLNSIYLLVLWSPDPSTTYNLRILCVTGFLPWVLQFPMYQFEFFLTLERCLALTLKANYSKALKIAIGILSIVASCIFCAILFIADGFPVFPPSIPTKCKFYGCVIDQGPIPTMRFLTNGNSICNMVLIGILLILVLKFLKHTSVQEKFLFKSTIINVIAMTILQWIPQILSSISYAVS